MKFVKTPGLSTEEWLDFLKNRHMRNTPAGRHKNKKQFINKLHKNISSIIKQNKDFLLSDDFLLNNDY